MYRAKVEQISGTRVRAGGKWLTCIGNKNVRVGDLIWTDGRCVYGYEKESQAPLVITPTGEKLVIPISFTTLENYTVHKNRKKFLLLNIPSSKYLFKFLTNNRSMVGRLLPTILANPEDVDYQSRTERYLASNIDREGNFYSLSYQFHLTNVAAIIEDSDGNYYSSSKDDTCEIIIRKNGEIVGTRILTKTEVDGYAASVLDSEVSQTDWAKGDEPYRITVARRWNTAVDGSHWMYTDEWEDMLCKMAEDMAFSDMSEYDTCPKPRKKYWSAQTANPFCAFIENESNWYVLVNYDSTVGAEGFIPYSLSDPITAEYIIEQRSYRIYSIHSELEVALKYTYLVNNDGTNLLFRGHKVHFRNSYDHETSECAVIRKKFGLPELKTTTSKADTIDYSVAGYANKQFPMPDGFYYKINAVISGIHTVSAGTPFKHPAWMNATIYQPKTNETDSDTEICTGIFRLGSYLMAMKLGASTYLIGVRINDNKGIDYYNDEGYWVDKMWNDNYVLLADNINEINSLNPEFVNDGLYICKNGELERIAKGRLFNQNLRILTKFKMWWERVKVLNQAGDES